MTINFLIGAQENKISNFTGIKCENRGKISCGRFHFVKFEIYFLRLSYQKFSSVLLQITNYIYSPRLCKKECNMLVYIIILV